MSQIGARLENLRNQERRSYGPARAFFCPKNLAQSLQEKGTARVIQGGSPPRLGRGRLSPSGPSGNGGESRSPTDLLESSIGAFYEVSRYHVALRQDQA
jgi:hypothetical protein